MGEGLVNQGHETIQDRSFNNLLQVCTELLSRQSLSNDQVRSKLRFQNGFDISPLPYTFLVVHLSDAIMHAEDNCSVL